MRFIGFKSYTNWELDGWYWTFPVGYQNSLTMQTPTLPRAGTTATFAIGTYDPRNTPGAFIYTGATAFETARNLLLQKLNILDPYAGTLYVVTNDGTPATISAVFSLIAGGNAGTNQEITSVPAQFTMVDQVFVASAPSNVSTTIAVSTQQTLTVPATGYGQQDAILQVQQTVQRASFSEAAGWTLRRKYTLTNNSAYALVNYPVGIDLGSTTALVSGSKALASGNDVRVIYGGKGQPRTLVGWNTASTLCWIVIDALAAGASRTYEVWYGNSGAGSPTVLSGSLLPAFDLATSTNAVWKYLVARTAGNAGLGGWALSSGTNIPIADMTVPGHWKTAKTYGDNPDDTWQAKYSAYVATGTRYQARFDAKRLYQKSQDFDANQYDDDDGVMLANPLGITQVRCDIDYEIQAISSNSSTSAVGQVVLVQQATPGGGWQPAYSLTAVTAPTQDAVANHAISPTAAAVAFGVWPPSGQGSVDKKTKVDRYVYGGWFSVLEVSINSTALAQSLTQAEETIMDVATTIYVGGGASHVAPYKVLRIGGLSTRRYATRLNEKLVIDAANRSATLYDSAGTTVIEQVPIAAIDARMELAGDTSERTADRWAPLAPDATTVLYITDTNGGTVVHTAFYTPTYL